jgi:hypothetical protein
VPIGSRHRAHEKTSRGGDRGNPKGQTQAAFARSFSAFASCAAARQTSRGHASCRSARCSPLARRRRVSERGCGAGERGRWGLGLGGMARSSSSGLSARPSNVLQKSESRRRSRSRKAAEASPSTSARERGVPDARERGTNARRGRGAKASRAHGRQKTNDESAPRDPHHVSARVTDEGPDVPAPPGAACVWLQGCSWVLLAEGNGRGALRGKAFWIAEAAGPSRGRWWKRSRSPAQTREARVESSVAESAGG